MNKVLYLFLGAILGGLIGSGIVLLLTPKSGNAIRSEIKEYSNRVRDEVQKAAALRRAELERELADLRGEVLTQ